MQICGGSSAKFLRPMLWRTRHLRMRPCGEESPANGAQSARATQARQTEETET